LRAPEKLPRFGRKVIAAIVAEQFDTAGVTPVRLVDEKLLGEIPRPVADLLPFIHGGRKETAASCRLRA
jgi:hypothetical protein